MNEPARTVSIAAGALSLDGDPHSFLGVSIRESAVTKAAATVEIFDGNESGPLLYSSDIAASGSDKQWHGPEGIEIRTGEIFVKLTGTVKGTIFWR